MAFLLVKTGKLKGQQVEIQKEKITIGRAPDNTIAIDDPASSAWHCSIMRDGQKYSLIDLNSTNGTKLNDEPVTNALLKPKDIIKIGSIELLFDGDNVETPSPSSTQPTSLSAFETKKESKGVLIPVIVIVGVLALIAAIWFLLRLL